MSDALEQRIDDVIDTWKRIYDQLEPHVGYQQSRRQIAATLTCAVLGPFEQGMRHKEEKPDSGERRLMRPGGPPTSFVRFLDGQKEQKEAGEREAEFEKMPRGNLIDTIRILEGEVDALNRANEDLVALNERLSARVRRASYAD